MKYTPKSSLLALFLALFTASVIGAVSSPMPGNFSKNLGFYFGSILIYGSPIYIACIILHYWLCKKMTTNSSIISATVGLIVSLAAWLLVSIVQYEPDEPGLRFSSLIVYAAAGIIYGFVSAHFRGNTKPA